MIDCTFIKRPRLGLALLALLAGSGCGRAPDGPPTYPTGGTVRVGGQPAARALVQFHPVDPATGKPADGPEVVAPTTRAEEDGRYSLSTRLADDGVPAGDYVVTVQAGGPPPVDEGAVDGPPKAGGRPAPALARFADRATTPLKATVKPDGPNQVDLDVR